MRVLRVETTRRYAKTGKLQRQLKLMGPVLRRRGEAMMLATTKRNNPFLALVARLGTLRSKRKASGY